MRNKKVKILSLAALLCTSITAAAIIFSNKSQRTALANENEYELAVPSITSWMFEGEIFRETQLGNDVAFGVYCCDTDYDYYGMALMGNSSFLRNNTQISGLKSISILFSEEDATFTLSYGWYFDDYAVTDIVIDQEHQTYNFDGELPSFFKLNCNKTYTHISSITLTYSCIETELPEKYNHNSFEYMLINNDTEYAVIGYEDGIKNAVVPSTYNDLPVTTIYAGAFNHCESIVSVTLPDSITHISNFAFYDCRKLKKVNLPESVNLISGMAFHNCDSLETFSIPEGVEGIYAGTFGSCDKLSSIYIPESVSFIYEMSFWACNSLEYVFYGGTESQWEEINIVADDNDRLLAATVVFESSGINDF